MWAKMLYLYGSDTPSYKNIVRIEIYWKILKIIHILLVQGLIFWNESIKYFNLIPFST